MIAMIWDFKAVSPDTFGIVATKEWSSRDKSCLHLSSTSSYLRSGLVVDLILR